MIFNYQFDVMLWINALCYVTIHNNVQIDIKNDGEPNYLSDQLMNRDYVIYNYQCTVINQ